MKPDEIIARCLSAAQTELNKISGYKTKPQLDLSYTRYEYVNGEFIEESEGDRGHIYRNTVADSREKFIEYLIYQAVKRFAFSYECHHRRPFEDNRRQVNEIIEYCYSFLDKKYEYTLMIKLKDNIHIYLDLLDYYVQACKRYLDSHLVPGEEKRYLSFVATKQYAGKSGGMYDVAFCFEWVRYHISCFLEKHPGKKETFLAHEEQFQRLLELEKTDPYNAERYQLGTWDKDVFARAEEILEKIDNSPFKGMTAKFLAEKNAKQEREQSAKIEKKNDPAHQCAFYMLIVLLHTERNPEQDLERLLKLAKEVDIVPFQKPLEQLFVTDEYAVFGRARAEMRESARKSLGICGNDNHSEGYHGDCFR